MFKKKKIKKKNQKNMSNYFWIIVLFLVFIFGVFAFSYAHKIDLLSQEKITNIKQEKSENQSQEKIAINKENKEKLAKIKKQDKNKINILLIGRGGRLNDAPNLTDSIMLVSINTKLKTISIFSIPRDLYIKYKNWKYWRINKIYALEKHKTWSKQAWIDALEYNVEAITWEKIDYYINIDFEGFIKFVDAIWGIEITVPKKLVDYKFPDGNWWYTTFVIRKWTWLFDWETALKYARSRHSTSDFDRSLRQQQIIKAIRDKFVDWWFFENISNIKKAYEIFKKYVDTDIWLWDAIKIFSEVKDNDYKIISSNLNDSCFEWDNHCIKGWFLYVPERSLFWWASVLLVKWSQVWNLNNYKKIKKYLYFVFDNPLVYKENIDISVLNSTKTPLLAWNTAFELRKYWFNIPFKKEAVSTIRNELIEKSFINYKESIKDSETLKELKKIFPNIEFREVEDLKYSMDSDAQIEIIIWQDYKKIFDDLKNNL